MLHGHTSVKVNLYSHLVAETRSEGGSQRLDICYAYTTSRHQLREGRREWVEMPAAASVQPLSAAGCSESTA